MKIKPGCIQKLTVTELAEKGFLLGDGPEKAFLSRRELKPGSDIGTEAEVFVFYNEDRQLEATTRLPELQVGQVGCFRVGNSNDLGSFVNIGIRRDILIPHKEQVETLEEGKMALILLCDDHENRRLYGSTKLNRHFRNVDVPYKRGDEVSLMIAEKIDIGRRVIIDGKYIAALFRQEMTDKVRLGERVKGYIRKVEGKDIVVSMQREGLELLSDAKDKLMQYLEQNGGYVRLNDDTDPEEVKLRLHMSKKAFKKAAGMLFKEGKVLLTKFGVKINKTGEIPDGWERHKLLAEEEGAPPMPAKRQKTIASHDEEGHDRQKRWSESRGESGKPRTESSKPAQLRTESAAPAKKSAPAEHKRESDDTPQVEKKPVKQLTFKGKKQ